MTDPESMPETFLNAAVQTILARTLAKRRTIAISAPAGLGIDAPVAAFVDGDPQHRILIRFEERMDRRQAEARIARRLNGLSERELFDTNVTEGRVTPLREAVERFCNARCDAPILIVLDRAHKLRSAQHFEELCEALRAALAPFPAATAWIGSDMMKITAPADSGGNGGGFRTAELEEHLRWYPLTFDHLSLDDVTEIALALGADANAARSVRRSVEHGEFVPSRSAIRGKIDGLMRPSQNQVAVAPAD